MIVRDHPALSLSRQCRLLSLGRSSLYYTPKGEGAGTLVLMRRIDELFLKYPFYGARRMALHLRREGVRIGRRRAARLMRLMGLQAIYRAPRTSDPHPEHRVWPYLLRGLAIERPNHVWCADITYIPVPAASFTLWRSWTGRAGTSWPGGCRTRWTRASAQTLSTRPWVDTASRRSSIPIKAASSPASPSPGACKRRASGRWMAGAGAWTTSSSSGCGVAQIRGVYLHEIADGFQARRLRPERPHLALDGRTPAEAYRGEPPVDMMDKPLRALPTSPQAPAAGRSIQKGFWRPEKQPEYTLTQPPACPNRRGHLTDWIA